jgi:hypothetical protein
LFRHKIQRTTVTTVERSDGPDRHPGQQRRHHRRQRADLGTRPRWAKGVIANAVAAHTAIFDSMSGKHIAFMLSKI